MNKSQNTPTQTITSIIHYTGMEVHKFKYKTSDKPLKFNKSLSGWNLHDMPKTLSPQYVEIKCQLDATDDFYCRSHCLLNVFQAPSCPSSGVWEYYTGGCCLWYLVLWFSSCQYGVELRVKRPVCSPQTRHITLSSTLYRQLENQSTKYDRQQPLV